MNSNESTPSGSESFTVLVVDDDAMMRASISLMLSSLGIKTVEAATGDDALKVSQARHEALAAVLLDVNMWPMSSERIFTEMRRLFLEMPFVFISGDCSARVDFAGASGTRLLMKPFSRAQLVQSIRDAIESMSRA
jgi:two-component system, cell cycle sensor histidine kinase and response regulator CckA